MIRLGARGYNPTIGRFDRTDPVVAEQEEYSTYQYGWNNPVLRSDPNGDCPLCLTALAGAAGGAAFEYGSQVVGNLFEGKSIKESFTNIDATAVGKAAVAGAITGAGGGLLLKGGAKIVSKILDKADDSGRYVYRALSKTDDITEGLSARSPGTPTKPISHVAGKKESQWISTTKDKATAVEKYNKEGNGVVKIDLKKVKTEVKDISGGIDKGGRMSNYAKKDKEVLIKDYIPAKAIEWAVKPTVKQ
ncbi:RHS repeat-associated core domain-containing protein [Emticicia sp. TH156]|uniref:RHS repeat-associated core domain-containing protein n=1 Tax=Emticicia sp. TH156 TaxID=2067454 RepID=UPI0013046991|nr:RHS repeat-associated core domain-containing protein [Emticicia sp. TH156]